MSEMDYTKFFKAADTDGSGELSADELAKAARKAGYRGSDSDLKKMFSAADTSGDKKLNMDEFLVCMGAQPPKAQKTSAMRYVFDQFDTDGNGTLNRSELNNIWAEMGKVLSPKELERVVAMLDKDGDGIVNYEEFLKHYE